MRRAEKAPSAFISRLIVLPALALFALSCGGAGSVDLAQVPTPITVNVSPATASVILGATQQFTATVTGTSNTGVTWSVNAIAGGNQTVGTISASGLYTAPQSLPPTNPVTITATSEVSSTASGSANATLSAPGITVTVRPSQVTLATSATQQFTAAVTGSSNQAVNWSVDGVAGGNQAVGTISATGLFTAPANVPSPSSVTVTAASQASPSQSGSATVTITAAASTIAVTVTPGLVSLLPNATQQFMATVTGSANTAVTWSINGVTNGTSATGKISSSGVYTAPSAMPSGAEVTVTATSQESTTSSASAVVTFVGPNSTVPGGLVALPPAQALGNNDLTNSGFESGSSGWQLSQCFSIDNTVSHSGSSSLKLNAATCSSAFPQVTGQNVLLGAGAAQSYTLQGWVMGTAGNNIQVKLAVYDLTRYGDVVGETTVTVSPGTTWQQLQRVDIDLLPPFDGDTLEVEAVVIAGTTGSVWFDDLQLLEQLPLPVSAFLKYPNFRGYLWSDVPQQTILLETEVPQPAGMRVQAALQQEGGDVISTVTQPASATQELQFDGSSLALGSYLIRTSVLNSSNQVVATYPAYRVTKVSAAFKASLLNYIDTDNFLITNGHKVFLWGAYDRWSSVRCKTCVFNNEAGYLAIPGFNGMTTMQSYHATDLQAEMSILPGAGVSAIPSDDQLTPWLEADNSVGVGHLQIVNNWVEGNPARPIWARNMTDTQLWQLAASAMLGKPGGLGYYPYDEPDPSLIPSVFSQYQVLAPGNPGSITFGTLGDCARVFRWRDTSDVLSSDPYPVGAEPDVLDAAYGATLSPPMMRTWIQTYWTVQQVYGSRPVWMVLQLFDQKGNFPSYEQLKQQAYNAIINGATGIMWWGFVSGLGLEYEWYVVGGQAGQQHYFDFQEISSEVMGLEPFLISPPQPSLVQAVSNTSQIQYIVKANSNQILIIASNVSEDSVGSVTFTLPQSVVPAAGSAVQVYSETVSGATRTVPLVNNTFTDTFNAYDVHIYIVSTSRQ